MGSATVLPAPHPVQILPLGECDGVVLEPVISPLPTAVEAIRDLVTGGAPAVLSDSQRRVLRNGLRSRQVQALRAFRCGSRRDAAGGPNEVTDPSPGATFPEELERIAATDTHELAARIARCTDSGRPTEPWWSVREAPSAWLAQYLSVLQSIWEIVGPRWLVAAGALDREVERLEVAAARRSARELIAGLDLPGRIVSDDWMLASHTERSGRLRVHRTVQLMPVLARPSSTGGWTDDDHELLLGLRYAIAPYTATARERATASVDALLGIPRAKILRALDRPRTPRALGDLLVLVPSGVTHHLKALEAAGLVHRRRSGRQVMVSRTARGGELLDLYERR